jgi:hypothetical protein
VKQLYTLEEIKRYQQDLDAAESKIELGKLPDMATAKHYQSQIHVMREVLLRMHESLAKHGPLRPSLLARMFAARQIRISGGDAAQQIHLGTMGSLLPPKKK